MAIPWNEDDPRDAALIVQNLTNLLRQIARRARLRQPPTVEMAQDWHRQIYKGVRLPVPYYAGEVRDSDSSMTAESWPPSRPRSPEAPSPRIRHRVAPALALAPSTPL